MPGPRRPSVSLPNSWLSARSSRGPCLGPTACVASESGRLRPWEAVQLGRRARDHHQIWTTRQGQSFDLQGHLSVWLSSLLGPTEWHWNSLSRLEFLSFFLPAYSVCCLPGRGGRGGNGQLPKSGSQPGLRPAPPCHTKRAPFSACKSFGSPLHHPGCRCLSRLESPTLRPPYAASMPYLRVNQHTPSVGRRDESRWSLPMGSQYRLMLREPSFASVVTPEGSTRRRRLLILAEQLPYCRENCDIYHRRGRASSTPHISSDILKAVEAISFARQGSPGGAMGTREVLCLVVIPPRISSMRHSMSSVFVWGIPPRQSSRLCLDKLANSVQMQSFPSIPPYLHVLSTNKSADYT